MTLDEAKAAADAAMKAWHAAMDANAPRSEQDRLYAVFAAANATRQELEQAAERDARAALEAQNAAQEATAPSEPEWTPAMTAQLEAYRVERDRLQVFVKTTDERARLSELYTLISDLERQRPQVIPWWNGTGLMDKAIRQSTRPSVDHREEDRQRDY